ncbi:MAG TPA: alpha-amylase family glycosyl hydrolase [Micromonosporaceae bacterium]|nr:alpha-amylase family glycosyl hydrolase [Micromonosporaceae bacterium]
MWWRNAVIYQIYIRSFADGNGDGVGDIAGIRARLPYVVDLGVDAIWINPWYPSPMADAGYDVADYRDIEPVFGTLAEAEALIRDAHSVGLRVLLDIVPNHSSDQHPWFRAALADGPGSPVRDRYVFRDGRGEHGDEPPNDWQSRFGGPAWRRVTSADGTPGQWYLHLFAPEQPDLNWENPEVRADFERTLRFWFDRGVDGFRIDVANSLIKQAGLPDVGDRQWPAARLEVDGRLIRPPWREHPHWDRDDVHDIYRAWRKIADSYQPPRVFVSEAWVDEPTRLVRYVRPDEVHTTFNFNYLTSPWTAADLREAIDETLREHESVGAPATWVLANHDVAREVSRYARTQTRTLEPSLSQLLSNDADFDLGLRRARAAALLTLALPGSAYVYQGQELGLPEVEDLPEETLRDPTWERSGHTERGRDGCRVPIPWSGGRCDYGFGPAGSTAEPWLPQPRGWEPLSVAAQTGQHDSMLELYRAALRIRRRHPALGDGAMTWLDLPPTVLGFRREPGFACVVNFGPGPIALAEVASAWPGHRAARVLLSSEPLPADAVIPSDVAIWWDSADRSDPAGPE